MKYLNAYEKRRLAAQDKRRKRAQEKTEARLIEQLRELKEPPQIESISIICECIPHASYA